MVGHRIGHRRAGDAPYKPAERSRRRRCWLMPAYAALLALCLVGVGSQAHAARLNVTVQHVRSERGVITLALYASSETFSLFEMDVESQTVSAREGVVTVTFDGLPPGRYAIAAFHDENGNGEFDTNFLGLPKEGYGFSNNAAVRFGPPSFEEAAVDVQLADSETALSINY